MKIAEVQLSYRVKNYSKPKIQNSSAAFQAFKESWNQDTLNYRESCKVMLLNNDLRCLGIADVGEGGINETLVDIRIVMQAALLANATMIMLAHNHPSGSLRPSSDDDKLTENLSAACKLLYIKLLDHLIITEDAYYSYQDEGRL